jgi:hypothetical protein
MHGWSFCRLVVTLILTRRVSFGSVPFRCLVFDVFVRVVGFVLFRGWVIDDIGPDSRSQTVYRNDFLILVSLTGADCRNRSQNLNLPTLYAYPNSRLRRCRPHSKFCIQCPGLSKRLTPLYKYVLQSFSFERFAKSNFLYVVKNMT